MALSHLVSYSSGSNPVRPKLAEICAWERASGNFWLVLISLWLTGCEASTPALRSASSDTSDATELFRYGEEAAKRGDTVRAEQYLSMALDRGFDEKKLLPVMLRVCLSSNRLRAALNYAEPYLREHPNDQNLRYLVATIYLSLGQIEQARLGLNHLLRVNPKNGNAHYLLGVLESDGISSARHFRQYLKFEPVGEHAAEVESRLTDLAVRIDMDAPIAVHEKTAPSEPSAVQAQAAISASPSPTDSPWFGDSDAKATGATEGVRP